MIEPRTLARPYARAAFEFSREAGTLDAWGEALNVAAAVSLEPAVRAVLGDPGKTSQQRVDVLAAVLDDALSKEVCGFLGIMAANGRLDLIEETAALFAELKAAQEASVDVLVTSAFAVDDDALNEISEAMSRHFERTVSITSETDSALLGGAVIRAGDVVIDGSVRGRLNKLAGTLTP
jgi:F-type H+-transporting ATPase subunit delta